MAEMNSAGNPMPNSLLKQLMQAGLIDPINLMMAGGQETLRLPEKAAGLIGKADRAGNLALDRIAGGRPIFGAATPEEEAQLPANPMSELSGMARNQREASQQYFRGQSQTDPNSFAGKFYQGLGALPVSMADWTPAGTALNMADSAAEGDLSGAVTQGLSRVAVGKLMAPVGNIEGIAGRQAASGILSGGLSAGDGGGPTDVLSSAAIGAMLPVAKNDYKADITKGESSKTTDRYTNALKDKFVSAVGLDPKGTSGGYKRQAEEIQKGVDTTLNITKSYTDKGLPLPRNKLDNLIAHGERKVELRDTYMPMVEMADKSGARPNLINAANELFQEASDKVRQNEKPQDSQWLEAQAARLEQLMVDKNGYSNAELEKVVQGYNAELETAYRNDSIPPSGSVANVKLLADVLRNELIRNIETPANGYQGNPEFSKLRREYGAVAENELILDGKVRKEGNSISPGLFDAGVPVIETIQAIGSGLHGGPMGMAYGAKHALKALSKIDSSTNVMYNTAKRIVAQEGAAEVSARAPSKSSKPYAVDTSKISKEDLGTYDYDVAEDPFY